MKMKLMILMMVTLLLLLQCNDQPELADRVSVVPVLSICDALEHAATSLPHKHAKKTLVRMQHVSSGWRPERG